MDHELDLRNCLLSVLQRIDPEAEEDGGREWSYVVFTLAYLNAILRTRRRFGKTGCVSEPLPYVC